MPTVEFDYECGSCGGTGLYVGMGEKDGIAVVCKICEGTGEAHFKKVYKKFTHRKKRRGIQRVLQTNPRVYTGGYGNFGGLSYKNWLANKPFSPGTEMRKFVCPARWFQTVDYDKKPDWKECRLVNVFDNCEKYKDKVECWERYDKETGQ